MLEKILDKNIRRLRREITKRDSDEWQIIWRDSSGCRDTNGYFWNHCGEREEYRGKLDALLELKKQIKVALEVSDVK